MTKNMNEIAEDLFNKIRSRFSNVKLGDENGKVTDNPELARFIDFEYNVDQESIGHVNVSLSEDEGLVVYYSTEFVSEEGSTVKDDWYNFLRELRQFSKKRMLNFDTRDITKSNLEKRDYQFLSKNSGEDTMNESKLYGTARKSYQDLNGATLIINHSKPVNHEVAAGRSQHISSVFVENNEGERFKYPYKHLNGARALGRHIANGGTPYDAFGSHIVEMSKELGKLSKFKRYINRSGVMAETIGPVFERVSERMNTIKKEVQQLQRDAYYKEAFENFNQTDLNEVPQEVQDSWVEALTIKTFQEEIKDVFPYLYNIMEVSEVTADDLLGEKEKGWAQKVGDFIFGDPEEEERQIELMTTVLKANGYEDSKIKRLKYGCLNDPRVCLYNEIRKKMLDTGDMDQEIAKIGDELNSGLTTSSGTVNDSIDPMAQFESALEEIVSENNALFSEDEGEVEQAVKDLQNLVSEEFPAGIDGTNAVESLQGIIDDPMLNNMFRELGKKDSNTDVRGLIEKYIKAKDPAMLEKLNFGEKPGEATTQAAPAPAESEDECGCDGGMQKPQTPLSELILSYFDRETGKFPKGETAILTMVEKDYGDQYVKPAQQFIEKIQHKFNEVQEVNDTSELDRIKSLSGLR